MPERTCCVVIFKSKSGEMPMQWTTSIDITVEPLKNDRGEIEMSTNMGKGKYFPGGPKCQCNGKESCCLCYSSESRGITGNILIKILTYFDSIDISPRLPDGPIPMLLIDGHQSCLDPAFIDYINYPRHEWRVVYGFPCATVLWQVWDASEQNGMFKINWYKVKENFILWKYKHLLPCTLSPTDIIPLLNKIFRESYGNGSGNLKAIADRGWSPVDRKLLEHPSLLGDTVVHMDGEEASIPMMSSRDEKTVTLNINHEMPAVWSWTALLLHKLKQLDQGRPLKRGRGKGIWLLTT